MCSLFRTVSSFLVLQNDNTLSESFGKISWSLLETMTVASHSFCRTWRINLDVKGFRSEKGMRSAVGSLSRASLATLSAASLPRIPTCQGNHAHKNPSGLLQFYATYLVVVFFFINRGWSVFNFSITCKADSELEKIVNLLPWDWYACLRDCLQLCCVNRTMTRATDDTTAAASVSSTLEPSVKIWTWLWYGDVISRKTC